MQFSGTPSYLAPEVYQKKAYDEKIDVFSFGTILWEIFERKVPYEGLDPPEIYQKVAKGEPLGGVIPKGINKIVNECRLSHAENRPDFEKIVQMLHNVEI
jgi:serine/threonine protein kinase